LLAQAMISIKGYCVNNKIGQTDHSYETRS
jgi:hypothetical protein